MALNKLGISVLYGLNLPEKKWRIRIHACGRVLQTESQEASRSPTFDNHFNVFTSAVPTYLHAEIWECGTFFRPAELLGACSLDLAAVVPHETILLRPTILIEKLMLVAEIGVNITLTPASMVLRDSTDVTPMAAAAQVADGPDKPMLTSLVAAPPPPTSAIATSTCGPSSDAVTSDHLQSESERRLEQESPMSERWTAARTSSVDEGLVVATGEGRVFIVGRDDEELLSNSTPRSPGGKQKSFPSSPTTRNKTFNKSGHRTVSDASLDDFVVVSPAAPPRVLSGGFVLV